MPSQVIVPFETHAVGYAALVQRHGLATLPHHRWTFLASRGVAREMEGRRVLRMSHLNARTMTDLDHVLFALKHEGLSLAILAVFFQTVNRDAFELALTSAIIASPTGRYQRRLWFLYEWLTERRLSLPDAGPMNYVAMLDPDEYYVGRGRRSKRHYVVDNLPGNAKFCPLVRRTPALAIRSPTVIRERVASVVANYDKDLLARAFAYLYTKETRSSFAIEREAPSANRALRFANLLKRAGSVGELSEQMLTTIQNEIVEPRYAEDGYREVQNYVGETTGVREIVHYIPPKPGDVSELMASLIALFEDQDGHELDPIVLAAVVSFGFVFIHPFEDGNGRLHRFLIHYVLERTKVTTPGSIVPVSATILTQRARYDEVLESFSKPLMELIDYAIDDETLTIRNETAIHYRFFDATPMAEALYDWLHETIEVELPKELRFLVGLHDARLAMREIVDMPDRRTDLFVKLVANNQGTLSRRKREEFSELKDEEISALEEVVRTHLLD